MAANDLGNSTFNAWRVCDRHTHRHHRVTVGERSPTLQLPASAPLRTTRLPALRSPPCSLVLAGPSTTPALWREIPRSETQHKQLCLHMRTSLPAQAESRCVCCSPSRMSFYPSGRVKRGGGSSKPTAQKLFQYRGRLRPSGVLATPCYSTSCVAQSATQETAFLVTPRHEKRSRVPSENRPKKESHHGDSFSTWRRPYGASPRIRPIAQASGEPQH